ncbi:hypothetical protein EN844_31300, partial [Mesorhizobium sp. M3A.F.Ca.ET.201.01.1.1]
YYLDNPDDMARFRRRQLEEEGRVIPPPVDENDPYNDNSIDAYPPAPNDEGYATTYPGTPSPNTIKRQPLDEASIDQEQPGQGEVLQTNPETQFALPPDTGGKATVDPSLSLGVRQDVAELQVLLDRAGASP